MSSRSPVHLYTGIQHPINYRISSGPVLQKSNTRWIFPTGHSPNRSSTSILNTHLFESVSSQFSIFLRAVTDVTTISDTHRVRDLQQHPESTAITGHVGDTSNFYKILSPRIVIYRAIFYSCAYYTPKKRGGVGNATPHRNKFISVNRAQLVDFIVHFEDTIRP